MSSLPQGTRLEGKVALVTGAGSGFGAAIAQLYASQGAKVLVCDINTKGGESIASTHENCAFYKLDVTSRSEWDAVVEEAISKYGKIDILVNNAGTSYKNKPTLEVTEKEFDLCFNVNVRGIYHSVNAVVPKMIEKGEGGAIVNVSSIGSLRPRPGLVWYNSSKGAVSNVSIFLLARSLSTIYQCRKQQLANS